MKKIAIGIFMAMVVILMSNCSENDLGMKEEQILGRWIASDKSDTLNFTTENDFSKSNGYLHEDHYYYEISNDSIEIGYNGHLLILVIPTKHKYSLGDKTMTIDFSNKPCYGFSEGIITYEKEN